LDTRQQFNILPSGFYHRYTVRQNNTVTTPAAPHRQMSLTVGVGQHITLSNSRALSLLYIAEECNEKNF